METPNLPVNWVEEMARQAKVSAALERPQISSISLKSGIMTYQEAPIPDNQLLCVVLGAVFEHTWYKDRYDPKKVVTPNCFSLSSDGLDMKPHAASPEIQSETCESCPKMQWASDRNGGKGKDCKERRKLLLIPASEVSEGVSAKAEMALLGVPVMSVKNWKNYVGRTASEFNRPVWGVLTLIKVVPDAKSQFRVEFSAAGLVKEVAFPSLLAKVKQAEEILMRPYEPISEAAPPQAPAPAGKNKY